jgi:EAL domain-containing protein (putative c-di-GMP-specific phosphodiesterase class I)
MTHRAFTLATISMAHSLGLNVVAEGVETVKTVKHMPFLRQHGCDQLQGHYLARSMPMRYALSG